jgi:hypothetical protein
MDNQQLISQAYIKENQALHETTNFGQTNHSINKRISAIIHAASNKGVCDSVLDYGCGKGLLIQQLAKEFPNLEINGYDPGISKFASPSQPSDIVICFDVLEHIEDDKINAVLDDISSKTCNFFIGIIDLLPAKKQLSDGRNAHLLIAPPGWWMDRLTEKFKIGHYYIYQPNSLNKKLCFLGCHQTKYNKLSAEIFAKTFFKLSSGS